MRLLLGAALETSLLILFALAATVLLRKRSAAMRHWLLAAAIVCAAAAPLLEPIAPSWPAQLLPRSFSFSASPLSLTQSLVNGVDADADGRTLSPQDAADTANTRSHARARADGDAAPDAGPYSRLAATRALRITRAIFVVGVWLNLCVLLAGLIRLASLASRARRVGEGPWIAIAREVSREYGLRRRITLLLSDHSPQVMTWGHIHPKVLLPASADTWPADRMRIVLRHELAHVTRGDWITQIAAELVRCVYWFNPLMWIACRRLRLESEQACDDAVLGAGVDAPDYATHLIDLARTASADRRASSPGLAMAGRSGFERRIDAMLNNHLDRRPLTPSTRLTIAIALCAITLPVAGLGAARQTDANQFSGWIVDPSGAGVANASITVTDTQTRASREATSDTRGHFEYAGLAAGDYNVEVRAAGFALRMENLRIEPGEQIQRNFRLQIGSVRETVTVGDARTPGPGAGVNKAAMEPVEDNPTRASGQSLQPPLKLTNVHPVYPDRLKNAGVQGSVTLEGRIATDGTLANLDVVPPANPELAQAALEAVRQWRYTPTRLHGVPADTNITIVIDFVSAR